MDHAAAYAVGPGVAPTPGSHTFGAWAMSEGKPPLGRRIMEPPIDADLGQWAAGEVTKHEELCGLRYEAIEKRLQGVEAGVGAINKRFADSTEYMLGIVASLAVALIMMFLNDATTRANADESDKREMRARLSLLTQQLANTAPRAVVVAPPGTQRTPIPSAAPPLDAEDLNDAAGGKGK